MAGLRPRTPIPGLHDFVIVFGPHHASSDIRKIKRHFADLKLKLLIVGDGQSAVTREEFHRNAQDKVHPDAPVVFFFHAGVIDGKLYLQVKPHNELPDDVAPSTEVLQWPVELTATIEPAPGTSPSDTSASCAADRGPAAVVPWDGTRHLFGCYSGAADPAIRSMPAHPRQNDRGAVIAHASKKNASVVQHDIENLLALGTRCAEHKRENRSAGAYRQFAEAAQRSPNATILSVPGDQEKLGIRTARTQDAILGKSLQQEFAALQARASQQNRSPEAASVFAEFSSTAIDAGLVAQRRLDAWFLLAARSAWHGDAKHVEAMKAMLESDPTLLKASDKLGLNVVMNAVDSGSITLLTALFSNAPEEWRQEILAAVNARDSQRLPVLCRAAHFGHAAAVSCLLEHGARLDACDPNGDDALRIAVNRGDYHLVAALMKTQSAELSAAINRKNRNGDTALHLAMKMGRTDIVEVLLEGGARCDAVNGEGRNAVMLAVERGDQRMFSAVTTALDTDLQAAINTADLSGTTALHLAIKKGLLGMAYELIESGARGDAVDGDGWNAWMIAASVDNPYGVTILDMLCAEAYYTDGHPGKYMECKDECGRTPLLIAAHCNRPPAFEYLLEHGAQASAFTNDGSHVAMIAVQSRHHEILDLLEGPILRDLINTPVRGRSVLSVAVMHQDRDAVRWLLAHGAIIDEQASNFADIHQNPELIAMLNAPGPVIS